MIERLHDPIYVTKPSLPPLDEFYDSLKVIWENRILTNNGPFLQKFEIALADYLGVEYISVVANGTLALIIALQSLELKGEVITTPFSFAATSHSLLWNYLTPVFVDIEPVTFNLDPEKIEASITSRTAAILAVHVFGNPCNIELIKEIAERHGLKVVYDAAHAFGVQVQGQSILNFGDLSVLSFHATKVFNTLEGGAIVCHDKATKNRMDSLRNFGFDGEISFPTPGINAKMNEMQAALGLLQLKYVNQSIDKRKKIANLYFERLKNILGLTLPSDIQDVVHNYSFYPIIIEPDKYGRTRDQVNDNLKQINVFCGQYFSPSISQRLPYSTIASSDPQNLPIVESIAEQILCLPIYPDLEESVIERICSVLLRN